jgi:hypothetical protein
VVLSHSLLQTQVCQQARTIVVWAATSHDRWPRSVTCSERGPEGRRALTCTTNLKAPRLGHERNDRHLAEAAQYRLFSRVRTTAKQPDAYGLGRRIFNPVGLE